jgi:hypothetical protein
MEVASSRIRPWTTSLSTVQDCGQPAEAGADVPHSLLATAQSALTRPQAGLPKFFIKFFKKWFSNACGVRKICHVYRSD